MNDNQDKINQLNAKFELLYNKQKAFINELIAIRKEINQLKGVEPQRPIEKLEQQRSITKEITEPKVAADLRSTHPPIYGKVQNKLSKDIDNKLIGGVCAGIAAYLNIDRIIVRIIWLVLTFFFFGIPIIVYLALWIFLGRANESKRAQLQQDIQLDRAPQEIVDEQYQITANEPLLQTTGEPFQRTLNETSETVSHRKEGLSSISNNLEKFVGENLISIAGVAITIFGVAIGVKYSIENDLISPLTRIVLGYLSGLALLGIGITLKSKYNNYSAVLVSGAIAILYLITYFAYTFYDLIPQVLAFTMMVIFTAFTVVAAINYNRQIIAHIGLVGAYAVPFLLSEGSDEVGILFSYMAIINLGILVISFRRYWKPLFYSAFGMTWFIYLLWYSRDYIADNHITVAFTFLSIFFAIFYLTFLAYKLLKKEKFVTQDILLLLANSIVFYGIGYHILAEHVTGKELLGLFTLGNALIHFIFSVVIYKQKLADKQLFYLVSGLVLVFITLAVPVQLDGSWVTLLWAGQAALLFWIGRTKSVSFYETLSYPLMILACLSISQDWTILYNTYVPENPETRITPLLNVNFLSALLFIAAFVFIHFMNRKTVNHSSFFSAEKLSKIISYATSAIVLCSLFSVSQLEIANYFDQLYKDSALSFNVEGSDYPNNSKNYDLVRFKGIWMINFAMVFVFIISFINFKKIRSQVLGLIILGLMGLVALVFLAQGLYVLSELRESYVEQILSEYYQRGIYNIYIRYVSILLFAIMIGTGYRYVHQKLIRWEIKQTFDIFLHVSILWILSSELINWMHLAGNTASDKLGLSILWGLYSLFLIVLGIFKMKKHLRIGAMVLFGITLVKLFFYDIAHLDTISKTIVLVSLGVLLMLISFLYNKFKPSISDESDN